MRWRAPDQEVDQRGHGKRLCKKIVKHINWMEDAMDHSRWKKTIKVGWWSGWWVGERFFCYWLTWVVQDKGPQNGCSSYYDLKVFNSMHPFFSDHSDLYCCHLTHRMLCKTRMSACEEILKLAHDIPHSNNMRRCCAVSCHYILHVLKASWCAIKADWYFIAMNHTSNAYAMHVSK